AAMSAGTAGRAFLPSVPSAIAASSRIVWSGSFNCRISFGTEVSLLRCASLIVPPPQPREFRLALSISVILQGELDRKIGRMPAGWVSQPRGGVFGAERGQKA